MLPTAGSPDSTPAVSAALRLAFYVVLGALALLEVFVSFRGLKSAAGMEQAQLAREVARGHGWVTQCIRPGAWRQMLDAQPQGVDLERFPDTGSAPLPALLLAPWFKLAEPWWDYQPSQKGVVYTLDRIVAAQGVLLLLGMIYLLHGLALRLFDARVAVLAALGTGLCKPLWELAVSGSPRLLLGFLLVAALRLLWSVLDRAGRGLSAGGLLAWLGVVLAALPLSHGLGLVWTVVLLAGAGFGLARVEKSAAGRARAAVLLLAPLLLAMLWWLWRNHQVTGDVLGASRVTLRGLISGAGEEAVARRFSGAAENVELPAVLRGGGVRLAGQLEGIYGHLAMMLAAPLALLAWLHRFRNPVTQLFSALTALLLGLGMAAMALTAPVQKLMDEHNLFPVLAPVMGIFGGAMVTMAWSRLHTDDRAFLARWGHALLVAGLTAVPLLVSLPDTLRVGFALRGRLSQWPPYAADRVARLDALLEPREIIGSDAPWFSAWYADMPSVWMPIRRADFGAMRAAAEQAGHPLAGVLITQVSAEAESIAHLVDGPWKDWLDVVLRGPMLAFDREMRAWEDFPYPVAVPLVGFSAGAGEGLGVLMAFYTDRARTPRPQP